MSSRTWVARIRALDVRILAAIGAALLLIVGVMWTIPTTPESSNFKFETEQRDISHAKPIEVGKAIAGRLIHGSDIDIYRVDPIAGAGRLEVHVHIDNASKTLIPALIVYDSAKNTIGEKQSPGGNLDYAFLAQPNMTYYLQVWGQRSTTGPYTLSVMIRTVGAGFSRPRAPQVPILVSMPLRQVDDLPAPTPLPFTPEPRQLQWRIGYDLGNAMILEAPELNPENDFKSAVREAQRVLPRPFLSFGLALLPFSKINTRNQQLVNPRQWTILDLLGRTNHRTFQALGVFMGTRMTSTEGGYHLVSLATMPIDPFLGVRKEPAPQDLIVGFAGAIKGKIQIHTRLAETKWENLLPVEDAANLPAGYETAKQLLDDHTSDGAQRFLYGTSIEALIRNRLSKLWLLNYSHPDTTMGSHPWGIFAEEAGVLQPLYIYRPANSPANSDDPFVAYFTASLDLNQDGNDELVVEASYRIGIAYKVISFAGGKYQEIFTSYYRGPAS